MQLKRAATAAICAAFVAQCQAADAAIEIEAPGLQPEFRQSIHDYVIACDDAPTLTVRGTGRTRVAIDDGPPRRRAQLQLSLGDGQSVRVSAVRRGARERYWIRCAPEPVLAFEYERHSRPLDQLYVFAAISGQFEIESNWVTIIDENGTPVWWFEATPPAIGATVLPGGAIGWQRFVFSPGGYGTSPRNAAELRGADGDLITKLRTEGSPTDHHELRANSEGNYLLLSYRPRSGVDTSVFNGDADATVLDAVVQEISPAGRLVSEWSSEGRIGLEETGRWWQYLSGEPYDIVHINSVDPLAGDDFVISLRHTDAVYRIDGDSGNVVWKLGGTPTPQSLEVRRDPFADHVLGGQHDADWLGGGVVSVYDNRTYLGSSSRAVRYRVRSGRARYLDALLDPAVPPSPCCGSADPVDGGGWLVSWGGTQTIAEYGPDRQRTFAVTLPEPTLSYRAAAIGNEIDKRTLRRGMDVMSVPAK